MATLLAASLLIGSAAAPAMAGGTDRMAGASLAACNQLGDRPTSEQIKACTTAARAFAQVSKDAVREAVNNALADGDTVREAMRQVRASGEQLRQAARQLRDSAAAIAEAQRAVAEALRAETPDDGQAPDPHAAPH
jgi:cytosine/adenosine deaminase-related metal-dependent hydrolase